MNSKKHVKSKTVPSKILNNLKHANNKVVLPQHLINAKNVKSKTASPPKARVETFVPKPKLKFVKAVYKVKCSVTEKIDHVVQVKNVILSEKGQFFKYAGPNQVWVPKKV